MGNYSNRKLRNKKKKKKIENFENAKGLKNLSRKHLISKIFELEKKNAKDEKDKEERDYDSLAKSFALLEEELANAEENLEKMNRLERNYEQSEKRRIELKKAVSFIYKNHNEIFMNSTFPRPSSDSFPVDDEKEDEFSP